MARSDRAPQRMDRRSLAAVVALVLLAVLALPSAAFAQDKPDQGGTAPPPTPVPEEPAEESDEPVDKASDPSVDSEGNVVGTIVDDGDRAIQIVSVDDAEFPVVDVLLAVPRALAGDDLTTNSFALTENGTRREATVAKLRDRLEVVVVIDTSGSMSGEPLAAAKLAAKEFVSLLDEETNVAVVGFGPTASAVAPFDSSREDIDTAIDGLEAGGETALYDGLELASAQFPDANARRFIVVLSDGKDTASSATLVDASGAIASEEANLYAITLESADADFSGLESLSAQVNGQVVPASDADSLQATFASIASRLSNQYVLSYRSGGLSEADLSITVDAGGVIALARANVDFESGRTTTVDVNGVDPDALGEIPVVDTANPLVSVVPTSDSPLKSEDALYIGAGALFLGVLLALFLVFSSEPKTTSAFERLNFRPNKGATPRSGIATIADRASGFADRMLEKQERRGALDASLERSGLELRPGEFIMAVVAASVGLGIAVFLYMGNPIFGLVGLLAGPLLGKLFLNFKASKRQKAFANQLGDTLILMAGSLRAGHGVVEAIDTVASQAEAPTGEEFTRAVTEARIGRDMVDSLYDIAERTESEDFIWVVRAISINRELGGDLAEILDNVGETIRDRNRLRDQVKALSAEGKVSAFILLALPILVAAWVRISNPEYMNSMTDETAGKVVFGFAVFALLAGALWLKKLVKVEF